MSIGGGRESGILRDMYEDAYDRGALIFAAVGNLGNDVENYPASYPTVVSVGAVTEEGKRAPFSSWSDQLELMGPGEDVLSTYPGNRYVRSSGTSMATPFVAGVAALVWSHFPSCSNQQIRNVLAATARPLQGSSSPGCQRRAGFGLVQARAAFDLLDEYGCAAGGKDDFVPASRGAVGGCKQPLATFEGGSSAQRFKLSIDVDAAVPAPAESSLDGAAPAPTESFSRSNGYCGSCSGGSHMMIASGDCSGFHYCIGGEPAAFQPCSQGLKFSESLMTCDWDYNVVCRCTEGAR